MSDDCPLTAAEIARAEKRKANRHNKKAKPRWKDRVGPPMPQNTQEQGISEDELTRCTRCPPHRRQVGKFRPLIGNGEHLCDSCYRTEFPATAMVDLPRTRRVTNMIRNKLVDTASDVIGVTRIAPDDAAAVGKTITKKEDAPYPSEVECRMCLERGVFRQCCSSYYCHSCYFRTMKCPGCETDAHLTGIVAADTRPDPGIKAVGISWILSFVALIVAAVGIALASYNASTFPVTLWGKECRGWFPVCDLAVCIDYSEGDFLLPPSQPYKACDREITANQVVGSACIYDQELYTWSQHRMGFDLCVSSPREEMTRRKNASSPHPLLLHKGNFSTNDSSGVYIFDDDFELNPQTLERRRPSAPWSEIINGNYSDACGVNTQPPERGHHGGFEPLRNKNALVFTGVSARFATTDRLNVEFGGRVELYLKMGSGGSEGCKEAYSDVTLEYSTLASSEFKPFRTFPAWKYKENDDFQFVSLPIPIDAYTNGTSFRINQQSFDDLRDHWAIDDFRIWRNLKPLWHESDGFKQYQETQDLSVKLAQCCYGSDQCSVFDKGQIGFDESLCDSILGFDAKDSSSRLTLSEILILYLGIGSVIKLVHRQVVHFFARRAGDHILPNETQASDHDQFPRNSFYSVSNLPWQYFAATIFIGALGCIIYQLFDELMVFDCTEDELMCRTDGNFIAAAICATLFDLKAIITILRDVFCLEHPRTRRPLEITVDLHPDKGFMRVGKDTIPLNEVHDIERRSWVFYASLSLAYIVAGLPLAVASLTLRSLDFPRVGMYSPMLGCLAIAREMFGPSLLIKFWLSIQWILAYKQRDRDELGRAVLRKGVTQQCFAGSIFVPILYFTMVRRVDSVGAGDNFILFVVLCILGALFGALMGVLQGVPTAPDVKLKCFPRTCCSISYCQRTICPCLFSCTYCGEIHSREMILVLALEENDMFSLRRCLEGRVIHD